MVQSGRRSIKIDAPIMITTNKIAVWMDEGEWARDFFQWLQDNKLHKKVSGLQHMQNKIKITFVTAKDCTMFTLKYASRQQ
tara:strand:+ start:228 stop:470 length:243 start_codon:yes stop_codon:yes gene_type:complete